MTFHLPFGTSSACFFCYLEHDKNRDKMTNWWWKKSILFNHNMYIQNRNDKAAIPNAFTTPLHHGQRAKCKVVFASYWPEGNSSCRQLTDRGKEEQGGCRGRRPPGNWSSALPSPSLTPCLPLPAAPVLQCGFWPSIPDARLTWDSLLPHQFMLKCFAHKALQKCHQTLQQWNHILHLGKYFSLYCTQTFLSQRNWPEVTEGACGKARKTAPVCKIPPRASLHSFRLKQKEKFMYQIPHCHPPRVSSFSAANSPLSLSLDAPWNSIFLTLKRRYQGWQMQSSCSQTVLVTWSNCTPRTECPLAGSVNNPMLCFSTTPALHGRKTAQETLKK